MSTSAGDLPLVSVAIVTYNQVAFLREAIDSVLAQDYPNLEIVVADDGSTDGTRELVLEYADAYPGRFVPSLSPVNQGITPNQNRALQTCTGKYVAWLAGDDLFLPGKISKQVAFLEANPDYAIVYHDLDVFESTSGKTIRRFSELDRPRTGDVRTLVRFGPFNGAVSNMVRRSASPPGFDLRIPIASDWLYFVDCLLGGGRIGYIPEVLARYRRHDKNITSGTARAPALRELQDHLFSCESILSRAPWLQREVATRRAFLLRSLRWHDEGREYRHYLRAALNIRLELKTLAAWLAVLLFGIKR